MRHTEHEIDIEFEQHPGVAVAGMVLAIGTLGLAVYGLVRLFI